MNARSVRHALGRRAFTLAEVLMVVAVMAIIAAVSVPAILSAGDSGLLEAARVIAADLQYVQSLALAGPFEHKIVFDTVANEYRVYKVIGGIDMPIAHPWNRQGRFAGLYQVRFDRFTPYEGVSIHVADFGGQPWVQFGRLGEPTRKGFVELDVDKQKVWILVYPVTGAVRVTEDINEVAAL